MRACPARVALVVEDEWIVRNNIVNELRERAAGRWSRPPLAKKLSFFWLIAKWTSSLPISSSRAP